VSSGYVTDSELVERARDGDADAFGELAIRHGRVVYRAALAALGSAAEAEDVAQEALVQAFRKIHSFRGDASFKTWVVTIAWRRALTHRRALALRRRFFGAGRHDAFPFEPVARAASAEQALMAGELDGAVTRLIRALPSRLRDPLLLAATGQYTYEELAIILGVPSGTLKWRTSEARRVLKQKLEKLGLLP
jgi:RNA polymerase sigma-70 factor (ECF subfamily)